MREQLEADVKDHGHGHHGLTPRTRRLARTGRKHAAFEWTRVIFRQPVEHRPELGLSDQHAPALRADETLALRLERSLALRAGDVLVAKHARNVSTWTTS